MLVKNEELKLFITEVLKMPNAELFSIRTCKHTFKNALFLVPEPGDCFNMSDLNDSL